MATVMTEWKSTEPNPDEEHLKALWQAEIESLERSLAEGEQLSARRQASIMPLVEAAGLSQREIAELLEEDKDLARESLKVAERQLAKPPVDIEALHKQDLSLAQANAERMESSGNPWWQGWIWNPSYGGWWMCWNGEAEEVPNVTFNLGAKRFDPRAQAWGEGWWDGDWSMLDAYFGYRLTPPSWGRLRIWTYPWLHGYHSLYSNDTWYKSEYAAAHVYTWVDAHQHFWRCRDYRLRFSRGGYELHPCVYGRTDAQLGHYYSTNVGAGDTVTIRVGVRLYCYARANSGRSKLDFQTGAANYVHIPYVYWYLSR